MCSSVPQVICPELIAALGLSLGTGGASAAPEEVEEPGIEGHTKNPSTAAAAEAAQRTFGLQLVNISTVTAHTQVHQVEL